jgi:malate dehydrogenase (quinone)
MVFAGLRNTALTKYLIDQLRLSPEERVKALKEYVPEAELRDWELLEAGQRVQVIKKDRKQGGVLEFGTEVVIAKDGTVAALLGASPGASIATAAMLGLLARCFPKQYATEQWQSKIKEMAPSFNVALSKDQKLLKATRERTARVLQME